MTLLFSHTHTVYSIRESSLNTRRNRRSNSSAHLLDIFIIIIHTLKVSCQNLGSQPGFSYDPSAYWLYQYGTTDDSEIG